MHRAVVELYLFFVLEKKHLYGFFPYAKMNVIMSITLEMEAGIE